ncbi:MAG TPA: tetratricopeptide repeat protein [Fimbriimonadaceae bacterium]|nr:tetratricopeptide repeat protein [Fimbriimonadaceae bacterium]
MVVDNADPRSRADALYHQGDYAGAVAEYRNAVKLAPTSAQALKGLGLSLVLSQSVDEGLDACAKAAALMPADAECRYAHGFALGSAQRYKEAADEFDATLSLQPNHVGAKSSLVQALMAYSKELFQSGDPFAAEAPLARAYKIDGRNPQLTGTLLGLYHSTKQKGKAIKMYQELDDALKSQPLVKSVIEKMEADPECQNAIRHAQMAVRSTSGTAKPAQAAPTVKTVPCPNCRQLIMEFAAICPHCNFQNRATGTFAGRDTGPSVMWQEVALTILAILWCAGAAWDIYAALQIELEPLKATLATFSLARLGIGVGLLLKSDWVGFIAKIVCYITLFSSGYGVMVGWGLGYFVPGAISFFQMCMAGFLIYLINTVLD